jgi:hypothetical protein
MAPASFTGVVIVCIWATRFWPFQCMHYFCHFYIKKKCLDVFCGCTENYVRLDAGGHNEFQHE